MVAEHGFACLVETGDKKILFDTGQGQALMNNMQHMDIAKDIDMLVFSHGHYDHTGGLTRYLKELSEYTSEIYASKHLFDEHYKEVDSGYSYLGIGTERSEVEKLYNLHLNENKVEIADHIILSGPVKRFEEFNADKLLCARVDGEYGKDMFRDEQYLVIRAEKGIHVVTGCTHCGAVNMLKDIREKFPDDKLLSVTGGLHMFRSTEEQTEHVIKFLEAEDVESINTGHCTGLDAAIQMKNRLGERVTITKAGMVIQL